MLDDTFFDSLLAGRNAAQHPVFVWGPPAAPASNGLAARLARRAALSLADVERAATLLLAELSGLRVDVEIGRGEIPSRDGSGFAVRIVAEQPETGEDLRTFELVCFGRSAVRDEVTVPLARIAGKLPLRRAVTVSSDAITSPVCFAALHIPGRCELGIVGDGGDEKITGLFGAYATIAV